jgi:hypothetical protein
LQHYVSQYLADNLKKEIAMFKKGHLLVLLAVITLLGGVTLAVFAQTGWPTSSEISGEPVGAFTQDIDLVLGDDPDEDGYQGEVIVNTGDSHPLSEEAENSGVIIDWDVLLEGQPDQNDGAAGETREGESRWSTNFFYEFVAGTTLIPRSSATTWTYNGGGCVSASAGNDLFNIHLQLPQGSRVDYLRIYYYDTAVNDGQAWLTVYSGSGETFDLIAVNTASNTGYGTALSPFAGVVVENANYAYVLNFRPNQTGSTMRLCGFRVAYRLP